MTHLLDSSAFFAFFFDEPGRERVEALFHDRSVSVGISALTAVELWARLRAGGREKAFDMEWNEHLPLFERVVEADLPLCLKAIELRRASRARLPVIDAVIAAGAAATGAVLVHRDPHFAAIPANLKQERLPGR